jgi:nickel transport system ATP-binding protein
MDMRLLAFDRVAKAYAGGGLFGRSVRRTVLADASFAIEAGECVALVGPSGAGKSTLGRLALGLERPDAGIVLYQGAPLDPRDRASRQALQAVFQDPQGAVNPRFTAAEVLAEPLRNFFGLRGPGLVERTRALLAEVELDPAASARPVGQFSGGQLQRLCIARALAAEPRLIVLDEALSSLDSALQTRILGLLKALRQRTGTGYLFITHDIRLTAGFADRVLVLENGRLTDAGAPGPRLATVASPVLQGLLAAMLPLRPSTRGTPGATVGHGVDRQGTPWNE